MCGVAPERQSAGRTRLARPELVTLYGVWIPGTLDPGVGRAPWTGQRVVLRRFVALGKEFSQTTWWIVGGGVLEEKRTVEGAVVNQRVEVRKREAVNWKVKRASWIIKKATSES